MRKNLSLDCALFLLNASSGARSSNCDAKLTTIGAFSWLFPSSVACSARSALITSANLRLRSVLLDQ